MARIAKIISIILLIVLTFEVSELTCQGENTANIAGMANGYQISQHDSKDIQSAFAGVINQCQCLCHFAFLYPSSLSIRYDQTESLLIPINDPSLKKMSMDIFQPPKFLS